MGTVSLLQVMAYLTNRSLNKRGFIFFLPNQEVWRWVVAGMHLQSHLGLSQHPAHDPKIATVALGIMYTS